MQKVILISGYIEFVHFCIYKCFCLLLGDVDWANEMEFAARKVSDACQLKSETCRYLRGD